MLEPQDWGEKVDRLLGHFTQLSEAHQSLVRVRQQFDLLEPVFRTGNAYREQAGELEHSERLMHAIDTFFAQKTIDVFSPEVKRRREDLVRVSSRREMLGREIEDAQERCRSIQNEIERAGGTRLNEIPLLIETERTHAEQKRKELVRLQGAPQVARISETICDERTFVTIQQRLPALRIRLQTAISRCNASRDGLVLNRGSIRHDLEESRRELEGLKRPPREPPRMVRGVAARTL